MEVVGTAKTSSPSLRKEGQVKENPTGLSEREREAINFLSTNVLHACGCIDAICFSPLTAVCVIVREKERCGQKGERERDERRVGTSFACFCVCVCVEICRPWALDVVHIRYEQHTHSHASRRHTYWPRALSSLSLPNHTHTQ